MEIGKVPRLWFRYVDDVWGVWNGSEVDFGRFVEVCNRVEGRIKVTSEVCRVEAAFLDVKVTRMECGRMKTELYVKPTDRTRYLHRDSDHPRHVKEGIARGQARRLRRICSEDGDYDKYAKMVEEKLTSRGYGEQQVREMRQGKEWDRREALKRVRRKEDKKINFVTTHSAHLPNMNRILKRHGHYLMEDGLEHYIKELPRLSLRRGKNLADLVVNAKRREQGGQSGPCGRKCALCGMMKEVKEVKDKEGKEIGLRGRMDCKTVGAIYGFYCERCDKVIYVGKTMNKVAERFYGHRGDLKSVDESKPVWHFRRDGHKEEDMKVVVLEEVKGRDDTYRVVRERWWINRLGTFQEENRRK